MTVTRLRLIKPRRQPLVGLRRSWVRFLARLPLRVVQAFLRSDLGIRPLLGFRPFFPKISCLRCERDLGRGIARLPYRAAYRSHSAPWESGSSAASLSSVVCRLAAHSRASPGESRALRTVDLLVVDQANFDTTQCWPFPRNPGRKD